MDYLDFDKKQTKAQGSVQRLSQSLREKRQPQSLLQDLRSFLAGESGSSFLEQLLV